MQIIVVIIGILLINNFTRKVNINTSNLSKAIISIILFIFLTYAYVFIVGFIAMIPVYFLGKDIGDGSDNGLWAYALIVSMVLSPILSLITTRKMLWTKTINNISVDTPIKNYTHQDQDGPIK